MIILFGTTLLCYVLWRNSDFIVWDDTSSASFNVFSNNLRYDISDPAFLSKWSAEAFGNLSGAGYRPWSTIWRAFGAAHFFSPDTSPLPFVIVHGLILALLSVAIFRLARHFVENQWAALVAVFLFLLSVPTLIASLELFSGIQAIVPLIIAFGLDTYLGTYSSDKGSSCRVAIVGLLMLIGPWFREFTGVLPFLILLLEIWRRPSRSVWLVTTFLGCLHALFPTALISWILFPQLPILPVFKIGNLNHFLVAGTGGASFWEIVRGLHWRIFPDLVSLLPPTVYILIAFFFVEEYRKGRLLKQDTLFLVIFAAVTSLPFLKLFNEQVHLGYSLLPISIIGARSIETLLSVAFRRGGSAKWLFVGVLAVIIADHSINAYAVRKVTWNMYDNIRRVSSWLVRNVPRGTYVLGNAHHLEDIRFYSDGYIDPWDCVGGTPNNEHWLTTKAGLVQFFRNKDTKEVLLLDVNIGELRGQRRKKRRHPLVAGHLVDWDYLGTIGRLCVRYPFVDPLRFLLPTSVTVWPGPADLEFDFYRGPALNGVPFLKEVSATYDLYRVKGNTVYQSYPDPTLLAENYKSFNIVGYLRGIYAIPQSGGPFDIERIRRRDYAVQYQGSTVEDVKTAIDEDAARR